MGGMEKSKIEEFSLRRVLTIFLLNFFATLAIMLVVIPIAQAYWHPFGGSMAAGAILGISVGAVAGLISLALSYLRRKK